MFIMFLDCASLVGIGGARYNSHKIMAQKPADGASYYARRFDRPRPL